jgi:hypothetical protein
MEVSTKFVPIFSIPIEVEITNKQPQVIIINLKIKKPVDKLVSSRLSTRAINNSKIPRTLRVSRSHGKRDGKRVFLNSESSECVGGPTNKNTTRSTNSRTVIKTVKSLGRKFPNKL